MNEAVKMHAVIKSNHDTFICLPFLLQGSEETQSHHNNNNNKRQRAGDWVDSWEI